MLDVLYIIWQIYKEKFVAKLKNEWKNFSSNFTKWVFGSVITSQNDQKFVKVNKNKLKFCRYGSGVEHIIGNDEVVSSILTSGTSFFQKLIYRYGSSNS